MATEKNNKTSTRVEIKRINYQGGTMQRAQSCSASGSLQILSTGLRKASPPLTYRTQDQEKTKKRKIALPKTTIDTMSARIGRGGGGK